MNRAHAMWIALMGAVVVSGSFAASLKIDLPNEAATLKAGPGADVANGQCLICHSAEYITTQPRDKPLAFWKAEIEKMRKVYGAPIPDDQVDVVADYLTRSYGIGNP
jgi:sulfite dehydrogenase (cytochrome) subunit B